MRNYELIHTQLSNRDLNNRQRASLRYMYRFIKQYCEMDGQRTTFEITSTHFDDEEASTRNVTVCLETTFPDNPMWELLDGWHVHVSLGPRGGIKILSCRKGLRKSTIWTKTKLAERWSCSV